MQLAPRVCVVTDCSELVTVRNEYKGCGVLVHMNCSAGHRYTWSSSPQHVDSRGRAIYSNNLLLSCAYIVSGNSFSKLRLMFKFMGLKFITSTMHYRYVLFVALHVSIIIYAIKIMCRYQNAFVIPPIKTYYEEHQKEVLSRVAGAQLIVAGDGRCDSSRIFCDVLHLLFHGYCH